MECLPYIDEHVISVDASRADTWSALLMLWCRAVRVPFFSLDETVPMQRLALTGRHPFAVYKLVFELDDPDDVDDQAPAHTRLSARSWAEFPGVHGKVYRALVIGTPAHRIAVRRLLRRIAADARAHWGANASETAAVMPCDALAAAACTRADRAISIDAPPSTVFAWLCQLRVAPYSYDVLDNFGRRSPRRRTAGLRHLEVGQRFMRVFTLHSFVDAEHITLQTKRASVTYAVSPQHHGTRLHVRVLFDVPGLMGRIAAAGDAVMMRKQLLSVKSLAEREAAQMAPRARRTQVAEIDERFVGGRHDYADAFEIELPKTDTRTPEQAFRAALPQASSSLGFVPLVHGLVLRFRLGPLVSPDHLFGWRVVRSDSEVIHLEAEGPLMRGIIVGRRADPSTAVLTTFVVYVRRAPARIVWALVGPLHRRIAPHLLERGAAVPR